MRTYFFNSLLLLVLVGCGTGSNKNVNGSEKDSVSVEKTDVVEKSGEIPSKLTEEVSEPQIKAIEFTARNKYLNANFYYITITAHIDLEDGNAYAKRYTKCIAQYTDEVLSEDSTLYEGTWKSTSVKRGNNYLSAYDIVCDSKDSHMEIYTTEKFDYMFCNHFCNDVYWKFHEGQTKYARKIENVQYITDGKDSNTSSSSNATHSETSGPISSSSDGNKNSSIGYDVTSTRLLNEQDIKGLSNKELRIVRNEIYARHGYIFKSSDLKNYFSQFSWYKPEATDVSSFLSEIEIKNIDFLKKHEE